MRTSSNNAGYNPNAAIMYVDMNSYFASCEQQLRPELRGRPIGVCAGNHAWACIIAPSREAKLQGVKTGMRITEAKQICRDIIGIPARPVEYRKFHIKIMDVLRRYCDDVLAKSIDEAAMNLSAYSFVYKDLRQLALQIKADLLGAVGRHITASIGIAPNTFLAKLATEIEKPNGLVHITPDNLDGYLAGMKLTDLPGIASRNARRLEMIGIKDPLQMRHTSQSLLRKAFGGIAGYYWHCRLNFAEVDFHQNDYRGMSATRTTSPEHRTPEKLEAMLVSLCTKLEQRLVKACQFCRQGSFFVRYANHTGWEVPLRFAEPLQDASELRSYVHEQIRRFEAQHRYPVFNSGCKQMGINISDFVREDHLQYSLWDDRFKQNHLRKVLYGIKDKWGKYSIRKATEALERSEIKDAIGFGSVKDLYETDSHELNNFLLEETDE